MRFRIEIFKDPVSEKEPVKIWIESLSWPEQGRIFARLKRIEVGNYGDFKSLGAGLFELRFHFGSGYRLYFSRQKESLILLLVGGNKSSQIKDINKAFEYLKIHEEDSKNG